MFKRLLGHAVTLAVPGLLAATSLTALVAKYVLPYDWDMNQALLMGTVLSATDPVAVVALLKELSVSERLATLIEGESLLNDGTAMVFFIMFRDAIVDHSSVGLVDVIGLFCKMSFGAMVRPWLVSVVCSPPGTDSLRVWAGDWTRICVCDSSGTRVRCVHRSVGRQLQQWLTPFAPCGFRQLGLQRRHV